MTPPRLETPRLVLRAHRAGDLDALAAMWAAPEVVRHIGGLPATRAESWDRMLRYAGLWPLLGFGYWAVEDRAEGRYLGDVGFAGFGRGVSPELDGLPETGWALSPAAQGRGLATEAVGAALGWLEAARGTRRAWCLVAPGNLPSLRIAARFGFDAQAPATYRGSPVLILRRG